MNFASSVYYSSMSSSLKGGDKVKSFVYVRVSTKIVYIFTHLLSLCKDDTI
jgi:hypothetical protein